MQDNILVANSLSDKGVKVVNFLNNQGYSVCGIDRYENKELNQASNFFKANLTHQDSARFIITIVKPSTIIFIWEPPKNHIDYSYIAYHNLLNYAQDHNLKNVILIVDEFVEVPTTIPQIAQTTLSHLTRLFSSVYSVRYLVVDSKQNLLKTVKKFLLEGGGEQHEIIHA